jgi:hypothetical protein
MSTKKTKIDTLRAVAQEKTAALEAAKAELAATPLEEFARVAAARHARDEAQA